MVTLVCMNHVGGICVAVCLLSLRVGTWLSCMSSLRMCACRHHHVCMHEVRGRPTCCVVLALLTCRYMAFMNALSLNVCLRI
jgi:hypothetical protein